MLNAFPLGYRVTILLFHIKPTPKIKPQTVSVRTVK